MSNDLRNYYLDALGIVDFLYTKKCVENYPIKCLAIETTVKQSFCKIGRVQDFLFKMLAAIKINKSDVACCCVKSSELFDIINQYNARVVLLMSNTLVPFKQNHFQTEHPSEILKSNHLKSEALVVLKKVTKYLE